MGHFLLEHWTDREARGNWRWALEDTFANREEAIEAAKALTATEGKYSDIYPVRVTEVVWDSRFGHNVGR